MGLDVPPECSDQSRVGTNLQNLRRRDPKSGELLRPLFGQVAVATVRNVLLNNVASLQNVDKLLASKVAQLRERREQQLQLRKHEVEHQIVIDEPGEEHEKVDANYMLKHEELKLLKDK